MYLTSNLKHILSEQLLVLLSVLPVHGAAEGGEVDVAAPGDLVGQVDDLLLQGVQAQAFQSRVEILKCKIMKIGRIYIKKL